MASFDFGSPNNNGLLIGLQQAAEGGLKGFLSERARQDLEKERELKRLEMQKAKEDAAKAALRDDKRLDEALFMRGNPQLRRGGRDELAAYLADPEGSKQKGLIPYAYGEEQTPSSVYLPMEGYVSKAEVEKNKTARVDKMAGTQQKGREFSQTGELRKEYSGLPTSKATQDIASAFSRITKAAAEPSPAADMSLLYGFNKLLDPGSVVRETEFANAANAGSIPERMRGAWSKVASGKMLSEAQRADFLRQATDLYKAQIENQKALEDQYRKKASEMGLRPENVITDFSGGIKTDGLLKKSAGPSAEEVAAAKEWLAKNPNDPRAAAVRAGAGL